MDMQEKAIRQWRRFWLRQAGSSRTGRLACRIAAIGTGPYYARHVLARASARGYFDHRAQINHSLLDTADHVFIDQDVLLFRDREGGRLSIGPNVHIHRGTIIQTGQGGSLAIGANTSVQARCHFAAYVGDISIGEDVQIAPNCAFFSYNHGTEADTLMCAQPLRTVGGIDIGDDAWLGAGCTVLDGARIGAGAVIAAGAVVTGKIPPGAIASGVPARVRRYREGTEGLPRGRVQHGG